MGVFAESARAERRRAGRAVDGSPGKASVQLLPAQPHEHPRPRKVHAGLQRENHRENVAPARRLDTRIRRKSNRENIFIKFFATQISVMELVMGNFGDGVFSNGISVMEFGNESNDGIYGNGISVMEFGIWCWNWVTDF